MECRRARVRMERTKTNITPPGFPQRYICRDKLDNVDLFFDLIGDARHTHRIGSVVATFPGEKTGERTSRVIVLVHGMPRPYALHVRGTYRSLNTFSAKRSVIPAI